MGHNLGPPSERHSELERHGIARCEATSPHSIRPDAVLSYFDPVPGFAGAVDGALAGAPEPDPVVVGGFVELVFVVGALVWSDAIWWWLPVL